MLNWWLPASVQYSWIKSCAICPHGFLAWYLSMNSPLWKQPVPRKVENWFKVDRRYTAYNSTYASPNTLWRITKIGLNLAALAQELLLGVIDVFQSKMHWVKVQTCILCAGWFYFLTLRSILLEVFLDFFFKRVVIRTPNKGRDMERDKYSKSHIVDNTSMFSRQF